VIGAGTDAPVVAIAPQRRTLLDACRRRTAVANDRIVNAPVSLQSGLTKFKWKQTHIGANNDQAVRTYQLHGRPTVAAVPSISPMIAATTPRIVLLANEPWADARSRSGQKRATLAECRDLLACHVAVDGFSLRSY
jgi:hypothetical protein